MIKSTFNIILFFLLNILSFYSAYSEEFLEGSFTIIKIEKIKDKPTKIIFEKINDKSKKFYLQTLNNNPVLKIGQKIKMNYGRYLDKSKGELAQVLIKAQNKLETSSFWILSYKKKKLDLSGESLLKLHNPSYDYLIL